MIDDLIKGKSVAFVAQSPIIEGKGLGLEIDQFDLVYRTNLFPISNTDDYGSRCDIISVIKTNIPFIGRHSVPNIIHFDYLESGRNQRYVSPEERDAVTAWCREYCGEDIINPTAGMLAWFLCHIKGASRIKFFGVTGYQNKNGDVVNHGDEKHYVDEYMDELQVRDRLRRESMPHHGYHNFQAHNRVWRNLLKDGLLEMDQYSMEYFTETKKPDSEKPGNMIHPTAVIYPGVYIGKNVYIGPYSVIGAPPEHPDYDPRTFQPKGVVIEDNVIIREFVTIHAGIEKATNIGYTCHLQAHCHIGHDAFLENNVTVACGVKVGGHSFVKKYGYLGLNCVLHQFSQVGEGAMIGASAFAKGEMEDWGMFVGVPVKRIGWNHRLREKLGLEPYNPERSGLEKQKQAEHEI